MMFEHPETCGVTDCEICSGPMYLVRDENADEETLNFTPLTQLTLDIAKADPSLPLIKAAKIAEGLLVRGYCVAPF